MNQKYTTKLIKKELVAEGTMAFHFTKPEGFEYKAGQNADYTLIDPVETDPEGNKRTFSFVSSPEDTEIIWTTRMRDTAFKRVMKNMPEGTELEIEGPYGDMTLHNRSERPAVFLAGGIGITPFHSMVKDATEKQLPHKIFLFYSNRRPEDTAFLQELINFQEKNPNYKFIGTMTNMDKSSQPWDGEQGYITAAMIKKYVGDLNGPIYYIAGPPSMLSSLHKILNEAGVNDDDIRREEFSGY
jgi:ferredoxin-NADP reductase